MSDITRIVRKGDKVSVTYTGKLDTGTVFDSNVGKEPFILTVGKGDTIIGFDENIIGMAAGEEKTFKVLPEKAYGQYHEKLKYSVSRADLGSVEPKVGTELVLQSNTGNKTRATARITDVQTDKVTLDMNHVLAGKHLNFTVRVNEIL